MSAKVVGHSGDEVVLEVAGVRHIAPPIRRATETLHVWTERCWCRPSAHEGVVVHRLRPPDPAYYR